LAKAELVRQISEIIADLEISRLRVLERCLERHPVGSAARPLWNFSGQGLVRA
jgi:hypothetical protein